MRTCQHWIKFERVQISNCVIYTHKHKGANGSFFSLYYRQHSDTLCATHTQDEHTHMTDMPTTTIEEFFSFLNHAGISPWQYALSRRDAQQFNDTSGKHAYEMWMASVRNYWRDPAHETPADENTTVRCLIENSTTNTQYFINMTYSSDAQWLYIGQHALPDDWKITRWTTHVIQ
jgi:hypothetical protein